MLTPPFHTIPLTYSALLPVASMRKFHHKTRFGCKQCKARRVKCDELRPSCRKCLHAGLKCSFVHDVLLNPSLVPLATTIGSQVRAEIPETTRNQVPPSMLKPLPLPTRKSPVGPTPPSPTKLPDERYSTMHLQLVRHFEHEFYHAEKHMHPKLEELLALYIDTAWTTPYLLDEVLAYAAAHKSTLEPDFEGGQLHRWEAKKLQTRALAHYNGESPLLREDTCLPMFLFSSLLSHHMIFEASHGLQNGLSSAIEALTHSIGVHRGLIAIAQAAWPMFPEGTQQKFIRSCQRDCDAIPVGPQSGQECSELLARLDRASLEPAVRLLCRDTVEILQSKFDAVSFNDTHSMWAVIQDWLAAIPAGYVELLSDLQPEALVILAHFGVLLHYAAEHWFVGDMGARLVRLINDQLGSSWGEWLEWPLRITTSKSFDPLDKNSIHQSVKSET